MPMPSPNDLLTLCCFKEANLEPDDGIAAVTRVILNRTQQRYESDGSITGTILHPSQFSWVNYDFKAGKYQRIAWTDEQVAERVEELLKDCQAYTRQWARCQSISQAVLGKAYSGGPEYQKLGSQALLYVNLAVSKPPWATPEKLITQIGHHSFYRS
jgi:spore germination cell wall hydrolase CwlJ-like protein